MTEESQIKDPAHPCAGATPRLHSHFFTVGGSFGSRDATGQQVDDGHYRLQGTDTLIIDKVTFHYKITGHDTLSLIPLVPRCPPSCDEAEWSVSVAYAGYTWHRIGLPPPWIDPERRPIRNTAHHRQDLQFTA